MDGINQMLTSWLPAGFSMSTFLQGAAVVCLGTLALGLLGRCFGKKSTLNHSVSSAISILFIYAFTIVIYSLGVNLSFLVSPLPFITISGDTLSIFVYEGVDYTVICEQVLSMVILAFLANIADSLLPRGKNVLTWFIFRCLSVLMAMVLHVLANMLLTAVLPEGLLTWAPVVLVALLVLTLFMGLIKLILGGVLASINPVLGIFATFFFSHVIGKQITRAVLTTLLLSGLVVLLNYVGCTTIIIASAALVAYIPLMILLLIVWYVVGHLF